MLSPEVFSDLYNRKYAFIDAGCGTGGSISHCEHRFGRNPGLGFDVFEGDIAEALKNGHSAVICDLTQQIHLPPKSVEFSSMMDFLEHLPNEDVAVNVINSLLNASREFLFIRHPSFDDIETLAKHNLKFVWTDWTGHPNMMTTSDFQRVFDKMGLRIWKDYVIVPHVPYFDSKHESVVPLSAPVDTVAFDEMQQGPKPVVNFGRPIYGKFDIFVRLNPAMDEASWRRITNMEGWEGTLYQN